MATRINIPFQSHFKEQQNFRKYLILYKSDSKCFWNTECQIQCMGMQLHWCKWDCVCMPHSQVPFLPQLLIFLGVLLSAKTPGYPALLCDASWAPQSSCLSRRSDRLLHPPRGALALLPPPVGASSLHGSEHDACSGPTYSAAGILPRRPLCHRQWFLSTHKMFLDPSLVVGERAEAELTAAAGLHSAQCKAVDCLAGKQLGICTTEDLVFPTHLPEPRPQVCPCARSSCRERSQRLALRGIRVS